MSIDKRISEFDIIEEFDITTKIPIIQGSPLKNGIITPKDFAESLGIMTDDVDISGKADITYVDEQIAILEARPLPNPMITLTEAQYDNLSPKDPNTYYFIKE